MASANKHQHPHLTPSLYFWNSIEVVDADGSPLYRTYGRQNKEGCLHAIKNKIILPELQNPSKIKKLKNSKAIQSSDKSLVKTIPMASILSKSQSTSEFIFILFSTYVQRRTG